MESNACNFAGFFRDITSGQYIITELVNTIVRRNLSDVTVSAETSCF